MTLRERLNAADEARPANPATPESANQAYQELKKTMHQMILDPLHLPPLAPHHPEQ